VTTSFQIAGTVATFPNASFANALLVQLGSTVETVKLTVTAAPTRRALALLARRRLESSVVVDAEITLQSNATTNDAEAIATTLTTTSTSDMQTSWFGDVEGLGTIESVSTATVSSSVVVAPSPPPPLPPPPPFACTLDFLRPGDDLSPVVDFVQVDSNLASEFVLMHDLILQRIVDGDNDAFTCKVSQTPHIVCLDIAAPSTLSAGATESSYTNGVVLFNGSFASSQRFGAVTTCDGKVVGDGVVSPLDMNVLLYYIFGVPPYDTLSRTASAVATTQGATDVGSRCNDGVSVGDFVQTCSYRRLSEGTPALGARVSEFSAHDTGVWYRIALPLVALSVDLRLSGVDATRSVPLSLARVDTAPGGSTYEVRFARHLEYDHLATGACADVRSIVDPVTALYRNTLAVGQSLVPTPCAFDLYVWVPGARAGECTVAVEAGSVAMDGAGGRVQHASDAVCGTTPAPPSPPKLGWQRFRAVANVSIFVVLCVAMAITVAAHVRPRLRVTTVDPT
jgi:hypothetical protein